jgi:hypothetical protein
MAEDDLVMLHGRFSSTGLPVNWIAVIHCVIRPSR